ncbi:MAG: DUF3467 domain-containing protein [Chloroflexota bacterium]|nr:MAG: DUF3467 domain-containing protein [Chloroflexota bacterium]
MSQNQENIKKNLLSVDLPPDLEAQYVNLVRIAHSPSEVVLDFARMLPGQKRPEIKSRILMSPLSVKAFCHALQENIAKYEQKFGEIKSPGFTSLAESLFHPPTPTDE